MFARLAALAERRAAWVVAAWVAVAVLLAVTAPSLQKVGTQDETSFLPGSSPSQRADKLLRRLFPDDPTLDAGIVVLARHGGLTAADGAYVRQVTDWLTRGEVAPNVKTVQSAASNPAMAAVLQAPDGGAELLVVGFRTAPFSTSTNHLVDQIRRHLDATAPAGLEHHLTGTGGLAADEASGLVKSFERTAIFTVLLVLIILVLVYRSVLAPLIPLVTIGIAFMVSRGLIGLLAEHGFKVASMAETFMVVMIFGAGTDYCLFIVSRYREDLAAGDAPPATLRRSMTVVGGVIAASAFTVIVGFMAQLTARFGMYKTMGPAMGVAIFVTLVAGLTLTPALVRLAGRHAFWPSELHDSRAGHASPRWQRVADTVRGRPVETLLAGVILLLLPASGLGWFHSSFDLVRELPTSADARKGFDALAQHYPPGTLAPVYVVLDTNGPITDDARLAAVDHLTDALRAQPGIGEVRSITQPAGAPLTPETMQRFGGQGDLTATGLDPNKTDVGPLLSAMSQPGGLRFTGPILHRYPQLTDGPLRFFLGADGHSTRIMVALAGNPYDRRALPVIRNLDKVVDGAVAGTALSGAHLAVGGPAAFFVDMQDIGNADFRVMTAVLIGGIFVVLALLLRSLVAPFYLLASVVLSYAATLGLCALVFIKGFGEPGISFWLPPFLFIILVALGADYNIFIMSRVREEADAGAEIHDAVTRGLVATGPVITSAGLILSGTFAVLILAPLPQMRQIGFGVTIGVLIDTFIVRSLIVPAATMLLGRWARWPNLRHPREIRDRNPRHLGVAGAGAAELAAGLVALVATAGTASPITSISSQAPRQQVVAAGAPTGAAQTPATAAAAPATHPAATAAPPTTKAASSPTSVAGPAVAAPTGPTRIAVPAVGAWRFHLEGTRKIGAAGSAQPFSEDATTQVSRVGGDDRNAEMRLQTQSSNGSQDDRRRYQPDSVLMLSTQLSSSGMSFGGTLQPPQLIARWPLRVGDQWASDWTTGSVNGHTTGQVADQRLVTVAGRTFQCWDIKTDTTFTGAAQGQQHQTACWVPQLGMSVDDQVQFQGTYNNIPFDVNTHASLLATP
jgi:RND superfamily putative drug exporter